MIESQFIKLRYLFKIPIHFVIIASIILIKITLFPSYLLAQGDLIVFPKRIVFEGSQKMHTLNLANTGEQKAKYTISFVQIRMKEDGGFENITEPDSGQYFADPHLRIFPRTVTLEPKESQLIKIQLRKAKLINEGEYRSHIYIRSIPNKAPLSNDRNELNEDSSEVVVRLVPIYGITLPVLIRVGKSLTDVNLSNLSFEMINDTIPTLNMTINRTGNISVYGDINVDHISSNGDITKVGNIQGVAVYTPNELRKCVYQLNKIDNLDYHKGKLQITYSSRREDKDSKLIKEELRLE